MLRGVNIMKNNNAGLREGQVAVLDIGSSSVKAVIGERGVNKTFVIKSIAERNYSGFCDGKFIDEDDFLSVVKEVLYAVMNNCAIKVDVLYVSVPGDWCAVVTKEHQVSFPKKKKITDETLNEVSKTAFNFNAPNYKLINWGATYYVLDDNRRVAVAVGQVTETLRGVFSFVMVDSYFINIMESACSLLGIAKLEYVSSTLAEALYLFSPELRDRTAILVDCGYTTTTFTIIQGDGLLYQKSFNYGGGYITALIADKLNIDMRLAEKIKRKVNLSCRFDENDIYRIYDGSQEYEYSARYINELVEGSLDDFCEGIEKCLVNSNVAFADYIPLSLTGGGVSYIRGIKDAVTRRINMVVEIVSPSTPYMNKPADSSVLSLLDIALSQKPKQEKLFKKYLK